MFLKDSIGLNHSVHGHRNETCPLSSPFQYSKTGPTKDKHAFTPTRKANRVPGHVVYHKIQRSNNNTLAWAYKGTTRTNRHMIFALKNNVMSLNFRSSIAHASEMLQTIYHLSKYGMLNAFAVNPHSPQSLRSCPNANPHADPCWMNALISLVENQLFTFFLRTLGAFAFLQQNRKKIGKCSAKV